MILEQEKAMETSPVLADGEMRAMDASAASDTSLRFSREQDQFPPSEELSTDCQDDSLQGESEVR
jgi:hypothetical protein